jgi:hypothetical protein
VEGQPSLVYRKTSRFISELIKAVLPFLKSRQLVVENFVTEFWNYYELLKLYQRHSSPTETSNLCQEFDRLFSQRPTERASSGLL